MSTSITINLAARYAAAFGVTAISKAFNKAVISKDENKYNVETYDAIENEADKVKFSYGANKLEFGKMLYGEDLSVFAPPLIIYFDTEKKLIESEPNDNNQDDSYVFVERWANKPWSIDIRGVLIDVENRKYPKDKIKQLYEFFKINDIIKVVGEQFADKGIDWVYFKDINISPVEGFQDTIQFSLEARSIREASFNILKQR